MSADILRRLGDDMAAIFGRHPDHDRVHFIADKGDTEGDGWAECKCCGELFPESGEPECAECIAYFDDVAEADQPPPETVGLFDAIPMPADPYHQLGVDAE